MAYVTMRDVAQAAGVSIAAVSKILHGKGRFSAETRQRVLQIVDELGYVPDNRARSIRLTSAQTVGLLVPDLRNPYFAELLASMEDDLYKRGILPMMGSSAESVERQDSFIRRLLSHRIDGAIIVPQGEHTSAIEAICERGIPLVFVDRKVPGIADVPFIVTDPYSGIEQALEHLIQLGHRNIGFVSHSDLGSPSVDDRAYAFEHLASNMLADGHYMTVDCASDNTSRREALQTLCDHHISAIITAYSPDMIAFVSLLVEQGLEIGADISLISFDDISSFRVMTPQIAVISQRADQIGLRGVELLMRELESGKTSQGETLSIPSIYIPRASVQMVKAAESG